MKYYCEETGNMYNTEEECLHAMEEYKKQQELCKIRTEEIKKQKKEREQALFDKERYVEKQIRELSEMIEKYEKDYNTYHAYTLNIPFRSNILDSIWSYFN